MSMLMPAHRSLAAGLLIAGCIATRGALAQVTITTGVPIQLGGGEEIFDFAEIEALMAAQGGAVVAPSAAPSSGANAKRLERLKKLEYDRRPSSILASWAKPPVPESKPAAASAPASQPAAAAASEGPASEGPASQGAPAESQPASQPSPEEAKKLAEEKKKADAEKAAAEEKALDAEMSALQRNVALGRWAEVAAYLKGLTAEESKAAYERMLQSLAQGPQQRPQNIPPQGQMYLERNRFGSEDVLGIAQAAPLELAKEHITNLGSLLRQALDAGSQIEVLLAQARVELAKEGARLDRRRFARMLVNANEPLWIGEFLPTLEEAEQKTDREGLNLLARHYLAQNDKQPKVSWLESAWRATQSALAAGEIPEEEKNEALRRSVDLAPKVRDEFGARWLDESFTARPERGIEILAAIGSAAATALQTMPTTAERRFKLLELQTTAAKALIAAAPERANEWRGELGVLAGNWLREALVTYQLDESQSLGPRMQRDPWGNIFYYDWNMGGRGNAAEPIATRKILDTRPDDAWLALLDDAVRPRFDVVYAQLYLKVGAEARAFPHIERLARAYPRQTKELADEFLRVWQRSHDPNSDRNRTNQYMFMYGFEERANGIPLTRSKQERNLKELGEWVQRLETLDVVVDPKLLANAFTTSHSSAEVYRLETIEEIFGDFDALEPEMLSELLEKMRANLSRIWRDPAAQEDKKTKRKQQDIEAEVVRGYELARATLERARAKHASDWRLLLVQAELAHDENDYRNDIKKDSEYSKRRQGALDDFARAAELYASVAADLEQEKQTTRAYEAWFYAALGASDLGAVNHRRQLAQAEIPRISAALRALPPSCQQQHLDMFASALGTRISNVAPAVKLRYVREGLAIVGEHELVGGVKDVLAYYGDLVTEIQLRTEIDGGSTVGHGRAFGLRVDLRHTKDIERESGGFSKYLQNQNNANFSWNYGRPLEDYRDKFEESSREALNEHFEVLSITFNDPKARSRAEPEYGWRVTPYAYLLLKAKGPQVDKVPPLKMDLDFLDTSGYAVLPIESQPIPIDARGTTGDAAPWSELALVQTLDERQYKTGKLIVEVKATANGLVPELSALLDARADGFTVASVDDQGLAVSRFDENGTAVVTERLWNVTLTGRDDLSELPTEFAFWSPKVETKSSERFRYADADLVSVPERIALERSFGRKSRAWMWWIPVGVLAIASGAWLALRRKREVAPRSRRFQVPEPLTPFTVLGLLRDIERNDGLVPESRQKLSGEIDRLEHAYFGDREQGEIDLRAIAEHWAATAGA